MDVQGWHLFLKEITVEKDVKMHQARPHHTIDHQERSLLLHAFCCLACTSWVMQKACQTQHTAAPPKSSSTNMFQCRWSYI